MATGERITLDQALATAKANGYGRMLGRGEDNRLEPECWPHVEPSFHFTKDQKFFAIGSCFAKNIRKRLALDGYNILGGVAGEENSRNRYTPPAIFQELEWVRGILNRDDIVRDSDVEPLLLQVGPDRWADIWCRSQRGQTATLEQAIAARKELYGHFRGAFFADVVIITLGLIEAWWDEVSQSYVEFDVSWARRPDRSRFQFERLSFATARDYVERAVQMLVEGNRRVLITASPVILARTFTDSDIIVANSHSKSVLRAIAGEVAAQHGEVDYFPSYEIATLTRRPEVWEDDLIHVHPNFIARIMQHVTEAYVPDSVQRHDRALMKMANLVEASQWAAAGDIYDRAGEALWASRSPAVHAAGMRLARQRGDLATAQRHAARLDPADELLYRNHPDWMFDALRLLGGTGELDRQASEIRNSLINFGRRQPQVFLTMFGEAERSADQPAIRDLMDIVVEADVNSPVVVHKVAPKMQAIGLVREALELVDSQLERTPDNVLMLGRRARLLLALHRHAEVVDPLRRLQQAEPENGWARLTLARTVERLGRLDEALEEVDALLALTPTDAHALALKSRLLAKLGHHELAIQSALAAREAGGNDPAVLRDTEPLLRVPASSA
ncbi:tetratricopeptide (TPR) repeat protein [Sphingomonas sp. F9_3S_D5_B_2]